MAHPSLDSRSDAAPSKAGAASTASETFLPHRGERYHYGVRWRRHAGTDGQERADAVPLSLDDYLAPQEGDEMVQGNPHWRLVVPLYDRLRRWLEGRRGMGVFSDLILRWGIEGLAEPAPDIAVIPGVEQPEKVEGSFDVGAHGRPPCLVIEVVSASRPEYRRMDYEAKRTVYEQAGAEEYLILDPLAVDAGEPARLSGWRRDADGRYQEIPRRDDGGLEARSVGLVFRSTAAGVVVEDATSGERLLTSDEAVERVAELEAELARLRAKV